MSAKQLDFSRVLLGEWSVQLNETNARPSQLIPSATIEFHLKSGSNLTEGTVWRDDIDSPDFHPIETFLLAHLEVDWVTQSSARIYKMHPARNLLTSLEFVADHAFQNYTASAEIGYWRIGIVIPNMRREDLPIHGAASVFLKESGPFNFGLDRAAIVGTAAAISYESWVIVGGVVAALHVLLFLFVRRCDGEAAAPVGNTGEQTKAKTD
jgi:hypothetical protein